MQLQNRLIPSWHGIKYQIWYFCVILRRQIPSRWNAFIEKLERTAKEDCLAFYEAEMAFLHKKYDNGNVDEGETTWLLRAYRQFYVLFRNLL